MLLWSFGWEYSDSNLGLLSLYLWLDLLFFELGLDILDEPYKFFLQEIILDIFVPQLILQIGIFLSFLLKKFLKGLDLSLKIEEFLFMLLLRDGGVGGLVDVGGLLLFGFGEVVGVGGG